MVLGGGGVLSVLRTKDQEGERPYIGTVPLVTGHLAKDLTFYWAQSEQVPSSVGLVVDLDGDEVRAAGGFLIQALPGASSEEVRLIEEHIAQTEDLAREFAATADPMQFISRVFRDMAFIVVEELPLKSYCHCSWERVERALSLVGVDELRAMLKEDRGASIHCDFCTKEYKLDVQALEKLIEAASGRGGSSTLH
jgi:molecular chaperone Hsp33